jgi:DNA-binding HxlR family transcriptional regulator
MSRNRFEKITCSLARALDQAGDWWTFLIVRDALRGLDSFEEFLESLGIARNILAARLNQLCADGLMKRSDDKQDARRSHYRLTSKGKALAPALVALMQWGDQWISGAGNEPIILKHRTSGEAVAPVRLRGGRNQLVSADDIEFTLGPGADDAMRMKARGRAKSVSKKSTE